MSEIWFTADHHFCHTNIIKYCSRPFKTVQEMDHTMINKWNSVVKEGDTVYHLGDFALASLPVMQEIRKSLYGRIILLKGNHDGSWARCGKVGFDAVKRSISSEMGGVWFDMAHRPDHFTDTRDGGYILCGHVHEKWKMKDNILNVGVDQWDFYPAHIQQIMEVFGIAQLSLYS